MDLRCVAERREASKFNMMGQIDVEKNTFENDFCLDWHGHGWLRPRAEGADPGRDDFACGFRRDKETIHERERQ